MRPLLACVRLIAAAAAALPAMAESDSYGTTPSQGAAPMLGVAMSAVPADVLGQQHLTADQGVYVQYIIAGSAAAQMGIQSGDVILAVNGAAIGSMTDMRNDIAMNQVGDPVQVSVQRDGQVLTVSAPLRAWPAEFPKDPIDAAAEQSYRDDQQRLLQRQQQQEQQQAAMLGSQLDLLRGVDAAQPAQGDAAALQIRSQRAWQLEYRLDQPSQAARLGEAPAVAQSAASRAAAPSHAFSFQWTSLAAPATP